VEKKRVRGGGSEEVVGLFLDLPVPGSDSGAAKRGADLTRRARLWLLLLLSF
jgi:hypothetical protein